MWLRHTLFTSRHSTAALLSVGLMAGACGVVLGPRLQVVRSTAQTPAAVDLSSTERSLKSIGRDWEKLWREQSAQSSSAEKTRSLTMTLAGYVRSAPEQALALACTESDPLVRDTLVARVLRSWAEISPDAAANWSLQRPFSERSTDIAAVLAGVACDPAAACAVTERLVGQDPSLAHDHGCSLVFALAERGAFADAAAFAAQGPAEHREAWLATAFAVWAEHEPEAALLAAADLKNESDREAGLRTAIAGWSTLDPHALADYALTLPPTMLRGFALNSALVQWVNKDLSAAAAWIDELEPSTEIDNGVVAVASQRSLISGKPEIAATWAESIVDADLRVNTLMFILREWAKADPVAARSYAEACPNTSTERSKLLASLVASADG